MGEEGVVGSTPLAAATGVEGSLSHCIHWEPRDDATTCFPVSSHLCYSAQNPSSQDGAAHIQGGFALRFTSLEIPSLHAQ